MSLPSKCSRVLLLGATENLGSRFLVSLLVYYHIAIALIRSPAKLASLAALPVFSHPVLTLIKGDATDSSVRILKSILVTKLHWFCFCAAMMRPAISRVELLAAPRRHSLLHGADKPPEWRDSWVKSLPFVGEYLNLLFVTPQYTTELEDAAYSLAADLKSESTEWMGRKVGMRQGDW